MYKIQYIRIIIIYNGSIIDYENPCDQDQLVSGTDQWSLPLGALKTLVLTSSSVICPVVPVVCEAALVFSPLSSRFSSTVSWINVRDHNLLSIKYTISELL